MTTPPWCREKVMVYYIINVLKKYYLKLACQKRNNEAVLMGKIESGNLL